jgi:hypothetical protein
MFDGLVDAALVEIIAHLGSDTTYQTGDVPSATAAVRGVFDEPYVLVDTGTPGVASSDPTVFYRLADLPTDPEVDTGARITRGGVVYRAKTVQKDGRGGVRLLLRKV